MILYVTFIVSDRDERRVQKYWRALVRVTLASWIINYVSTYYKSSGKHCMHTECTANDLDSPYVMLAKYINFLSSTVIKILICNNVRAELKFLSRRSSRYLLHYREIREIKKQFPWLTLNVLYNENFET